MVAVPPLQRIPRIAAAIHGATPGPPGRPARPSVAGRSSHRRGSAAPVRAYPNSPLRAMLSPRR